MKNIFKYFKFIPIVALFHIQLFGSSQSIAFLRNPIHPSITDTLRNLPLIQCSTGHVIPHPTNCRKFIKCGFTDSRNIILECNDPTMFNPDTGLCDFATNIKCRKFEYITRKSIIAVDLEPPSVEYFYCKPGCLKPHPDDCSKFILCGMKIGENKVYSCPKSLLYNPYIQGCDIAQNVVCKIYNYAFLTFPEEKPQTIFSTTLTTSAITPLSATTSRLIESTSVFNSTRITQNSFSSDRIDTTEDLSFTLPEVSIANNSTGHDSTSGSHYEGSTELYSQNSTIENSVEWYNFSSTGSNFNSSFPEAEINGTTLKIDTFEESTFSNNHAESTGYNRSNHLNSSTVNELSSSAIISINISTSSSEFNQTESTLAFRFNQTINLESNSTTNSTSTVTDYEKHFPLTTHQEIDLKNQTNNYSTQIYVSNSTTTESAFHRQIYLKWLPL